MCVAHGVRSGYWHAPTMGHSPGVRGGGGCTLIKHVHVETSRSKRSVHAPLPGVCRKHSQSGLRLGLLGSAVVQLDSHQWPPSPPTCVKECPWPVCPLLRECQLLWCLCTIEGGGKGKSHHPLIGCVRCNHHASAGGACGSQNEHVRGCVSAGWVIQGVSCNFSLHAEGAREHMVGCCGLESYIGAEALVSA